MKEPRIEKRDSFTVVGMLYHGKNENGEIPAMWQEFIGKHPKRIFAETSYGVCFTPAGEFGEGVFDYIAGFEEESIPDGMVSKIVPSGRWLVFEHKGKLDTLKNTYKYIYTQHIPDSKYEPAGIDIEVYGERFDPSSNDSVLEIWIQIL